MALNPKMTVSPAGLAITKACESCLLYAYDDSDDAPLQPPVGNHPNGRACDALKGHATIGWGHLIKPGETFPAGLTPDDADDLLRADMSLAESAVNASVKVSLTQPQFDALCDFAFNCGNVGFEESALLALINEGNFTAAAAQFGLWIHTIVNGQRVVDGRLVARRALEEKLFTTTETPPATPTIPDGDDA